MTEHRRDSDAPKSDNAYRKWRSGLVDGLLHIEAYQSEIQEARPTLTAIVIKCDPSDEQGVLVIAKGFLGNDWQVAFHRADTVSEAVAGLGNRLRNGTLKWRQDEYANDK